MERQEEIKKERRKLRRKEGKTGRNKERWKDRKK